MAFDKDLDPKGEKGKRLTILSIDGGGVRGIIPAKILEVLETELKRLEKLGNTGEHHLWEYFDLIAGTSSGGLITAMITTPRRKGLLEPCCDARKVVEFFEQDAVKIFPQIFTNKVRLRWLLEGIASVFGPIYSAKPLEDLLREKFRDTHLSNALTSVIIPAFDTKNEVPVFFSNLKGVDSAKPLYDVHVKDACRATTAVPIFFPAANIFSGDPNQPDGTKEFNVIDGGVAVNDPTLVAVTQRMAKDRQQIFDDELRAITEDRQLISEEELRAIAEERSRYCVDFRNVLVLSLGAGEHRMRFIAKPHWSSVQWLLNPRGSPLLNSFLSASEDMVEYYTSMIFDAHHSGHHYLRIQTDRLSSTEFWGIDDATPQNLVDLEKTADQLLGLGPLERPVSKRNFATGNLDAITDGGQNVEALHRFARWLVEERRERPQTTGQQTAGESTGNGDLPGNYGQQTAVDCCRSMMRMAVGGCFLMMRTAIGGCCLTLIAVILVVVCSVYGIFCLLLVPAVGIGNLLRVAAVGIGNLFTVRLVRAHLD